MTRAAFDTAGRSIFHVAVIGSGPSGFYTAEALLRAGMSVAVDMFEQLPVPYGLVRFGVAPDHPKLKQVTVAFDRIAGMPGFRFLGGVAVGRDVAIDELRDSYDAVVLATGAELSRSLGIPGEQLQGCHHAGDFVAWYNGHPDFRDCHFDLRHDAAVIVGHGNVALDVARILCKTADELRRTDIASHALEVLGESRVREVHVVGRGTPSQARFSARELRDFLELEACEAWVDGRDVTPDDFVAAHTQDPEMTEKLALLGDFSRRTSAGRRRCVFRFGLLPLAIEGEAGVQAVAFERPASNGIETIACGLCFRSVGRRTAPLAGVPYDELRGVHANIDGRVAIGPSAVGGLYASGWSKRGPSGTIGTNRGCAIATVESVLADLAAQGRRTAGVEPLLERLRARVERIVSYADWVKIDAAEQSRGIPQRKPREKFVRISEMLAAAEG
jgi:ferredoxin--NADP+ reductase